MKLDRQKLISVINMSMADIKQSALLLKGWAEMLDDLLKKEHSEAKVQSPALDVIGTFSSIAEAVLRVVDTSAAYAQSWHQQMISRDPQKCETTIEDHHAEQFDPNDVGKQLSYSPEEHLMIVVETLETQNKLIRRTIDLGREDVNLGTALEGTQKTLFIKLLGIAQKTYNVIENFLCGADEILASAATDSGSDQVPPD